MELGGKRAKTTQKLTEFETKKFPFRSPRQKHFLIIHIYMKSISSMECTHTDSINQILSFQSV